MKYLVASALVLCSSSVLATSLIFQCTSNGMHPAIVDREASTPVNTERIDYQGTVSNRQKLLLGHHWSVAGAYGGYLVSTNIYVDGSKIFSASHSGTISEIQEGDHLFYGQLGTRRQITCHFELKE